MGYWLQKLDRLPPNVCRLLARVPHKPKAPLSTHDVAVRSGLSVQTVRRIARLRTWRDVTVGQMEAFKIGCGISLATGAPCTGEALQLAYLKRTFQSSSTPLFHVQKLRKIRKDSRRDKYLAELMKVEP
jgi:hypothetical protein